MILRNRATTERMQHIRRKICAVDDGAFYVYYDYIFTKKLELCSVWYPESISFRTRLSFSDVNDKIISVYKRDVKKVYDSYFKASASAIDSVLLKLKNEQ